MAVDPTFSVNNYNRPKVLTEKETYVNNVMMLLLGKPGFYPSIPSIGMNIQQYLYMFEDDINTTSIKTQLANQCSDFLPEIRDGEMDVLKTTYNNHTILIFKLPEVNDTAESSIAIGITTNNNGELIYNFVENKTQTF